MKAGDKIRVQMYIFGDPLNQVDYVVEEFRHCLGFFQDDERRTMGRFTPLCELYEPGPDSEQKYMPNCGEYTTNLVQAWMDLP